MLYLGIMLAGGCGALLRYFLGKTFIAMNWTSLPFGTLVANLVGSFLIGYLSWQLVHRWQVSQEIQIMVLTGFLGGFTTFSAFSLEVVGLFEGGFQIRAISYVLLSVLLSIFMCLLGLYMARQA